MKAWLLDARTFLKCLTLPRLANLILLKISYLLSVVLHRPLHTGNPAYLSIEPTGGCNLHCPECPTGLAKTRRKTNFLGEELYRRIIDKVQRHALSVSLYFQGEPFLHPHLADLIRYASQKKLYTVVSTNGQLLENIDPAELVQSGISRLIVCADGMDQETYEKYRVGGNLDKLVMGVKNISGAKKQLGRSNPHIVLQFLVMKHNEKDIPGLRQWARAMGANSLELKSPQLYTMNDEDNRLSSREEFNRYRKDSRGALSIKSDLPNRCWRMWHASVITCDGAVLPCCFDKNQDHQFGSLHEFDLEAIWNSEKLMHFRSMVWTQRAAIEICMNCTEGLKIRTGQQFFC